jgi:hypothetical protein
VKLGQARWRLAVATALVAPAIAAPLAIAASGPGDSACRRTDDVVARTDGWTSIRPPAGLGGLRGVAPDPAVLGRIYAYGDTEVVRSDDGGCSWTTVFTAPATTSRATVVGSHITGVAVGSGVWVTTATTAGAVGASAVYRSVSGAGGFSFAGAGLPAGGTVSALEPTDRPGTAYALLHTAAGSQLYAANANVGGNVTWRAEPVRGLSPIALAVDPRYPDQVDLASKSAFTRSTDGGATFAAPHGVPGTVTALDAAGDSADIYLLHGRLISVTGQGSVLLTAPGGVTSATHVVPDPGVRAVATSYGDYGFDPSRQRWLPITPVGLVVGQLQMVSPALPPVLYGTAGGLVLELPLHFPAAFNPVSNVTQVPERAVSLHGVAAFGRHRPSFAPAAHHITLQVGQQRRARYVLRVPAVAGPLDVDFLVDTTGSMDPAIAGLRVGMQQIVEALGRTTPNLEVGLGDFRDYADGEEPNAPADCRTRRTLVDSVFNTPRHLYRLDQRIAPVGPGLAQALNRLSACDGGDVPEADTIAVMQALTGTGVPGWVPPGEEAGFRPGATKVIVLITDSPMHLQPPYPTMAQTTAALRAYGVNVVGIVIKDGDGGGPDLRRLVAGSGTLAPSGGVACTGQGGTDLPAGAPLVCDVPVTGAGIAALAGPVSSLVEQVAAPAELSVHVHAAQTAQSRLVSFVGPSRGTANLRATSRLPVTLDYSCPAAAAGSRTPVSLTGAVGPTTVAHTSVVLTCLPAPLVPAGPVAIAPAVVAAQPPPPPPVTGNANPNLNPGAGAATEEEQQSQTALADLGERTEAEPGTAEGPGPDLGAPMLYAGALLLSGATALALRLRTSPAPNLARVRTHRGER